MTPIPPTFFIQTEEHYYNPLANIPLLISVPNNNSAKRRHRAVYHTHCSPIEIIKIVLCSIKIHDMKTIHNINKELQDCIQSINNHGTKLSCNEIFEIMSQHDKELIAAINNLVSHYWEQREAFLDESSTKIKDHND